MGGVMFQDMTDEQKEILDEFLLMLAIPTRDGRKKREAGLKPKWDVDDSHWEHYKNHIRAYQDGRLEDPDSGAHPLVHAAWRLLAIAYQQGPRKILRETEEE